MRKRLDAEWLDDRREPQLAADPRFPDGVDCDLSNGAVNTCQVDLPHPTKRCGKWVIKCGRCGLSALVTTAGRADDPRTVKVACKLN